MKIDLWYGAEQSFGQCGRPQRAVNLLGSIADAGELRSLACSLNGGPPRPLRIGPDRRRLASAGDFNVDLDVERLKPGENLVALQATGRDGNAVAARATVRYVPDGEGKLPYAIRWSDARSIQDVAHVVDGRWQHQDDGIRSIVAGYDRMVALGDVGWRDYEISVVVTVHSFDDTGMRYPSCGPGVGVMLRWQGHHAWKGERSWRGWWPVRTASRLLGQEDWGPEPRWGWWPFGAIGWYRWSPTHGYRLNLMGSRGALLAEDTSGRKLEAGVAHVFKMAVTSRPGKTSLYRLKVFEQGTREPEAWDLTGEGVVEELASGSAVLLAHHSDASFGDVDVSVRRCGNSSPPSGRPPR